MRILQVVDSPWAIGALAETIKKENYHHKIDILTIHPKEYRENTEKFNRVFSEKVQSFNPQIIHFHYWDTAKHLAELPICDGIKKILTHHNQKNLLSHSWEKFDRLVVHTKKAKSILDGAGYPNVDIIQHGIDIEKFRFLEYYDDDNRLLGYTGRIVPWKGLLDILKTAKNIGTEVVMMGKIDKADYWQECLQYSDVMDIRFGTKNEDQPSVYHEMAVYIGNSTDGIEEGPLGLLEAMACGIPVITTPSGEAKDIIVSGENGLLVNFDDREDLERKIRFFFNMRPAEKNEMRQKAWDTVRNMSKEVMGRKYEALYYRTAYDKDLVSVIIPTSKRSDTISNVLDAYAIQTYQPLEIIVAIDEHYAEFEYREVLIEWRRNHKTPIRWVYTNNEGYGIAQARNMGIFEASGHYLIFNDDRFIPESDAVEMFVRRISGVKERTAIWGDKGGGQRSFIENFFIIRKKHIVQAGMFNERINEYGGQSQEIRGRLIDQGFALNFEPSAKANQQFGTHNKTKRRYEVFRTKTKLWKLAN